MTQYSPIPDNRDAVDQRARLDTVINEGDISISAWRRRPDDIDEFTAQTARPEDE
jgi:hypothetical protein